MSGLSQRMTYQRVEDVVAEDTETTTQRRRRKRGARRASAKTISLKIQAACWVALAVGTAWFVELDYIIYHSKFISHPFMEMGLGCFVAFVGCIVYLAIFGGKSDVPGEMVDFLETNTTLVRIATGLFVAGFVFSCVGLWPNFSAFTPFILGIFIMGAMMSLHLIPTGAVFGRSV